MTNIDEISKKKAAKAAGLSFIAILILGPIAILFILDSLLVTGNAATTLSNIRANQMLFGLGIGLYLFILALDVIISVALYIILKPADKNLAMLQAVLRSLYIATMAIFLIALAFLYVEAYFYAEPIAYIFFISHLFVLGIVVFKAGYVPKVLGVLLIIASISYIILTYGMYIFPEDLNEILMMIAFLPAVIGEITFGIWILVKSSKLQERIDDNIDK